MKIDLSAGIVKEWAENASTRRNLQLPNDRDRSMRVILAKHRRDQLW
jgi:hypothetical protein